MDDVKQKHKELQTTINALQKKWGKQAIQRLPKMGRQVPHVPTGIPALDNILGIGGIPKGRISELLGKPTSGITTMALYIAQSVQKQGGFVLYFDHPNSFDAESANILGVNLDQMVLLRPNDFQQSALILLDAIVSGGIGLIIVETQSDIQASQIWSPTLDKIIAPLGHSDTVLLFLTHLPSNSDQQTKHRAKRKIHNDLSIVSHYSSLRLFVQKSGWLIRGKEFEGFKSRVKVGKNKFGPTGEEAELIIPINYSKFY